MNTTAEKTIYQKYRFVLSKATQPRAGARKQYARQAVVNQFNIPFAEVKRIVEKHDAENNITHEHTEEYKELLEYNETAERLIQEHGTAVCPQCGWKPEDGNYELVDPPLTPEQNQIRVRVNPYLIEIHQERKPMLSCFGCYLKVSWDV